MLMNESYFALQPHFNVLAYIRNIPQEGMSLIPNTLLCLGKQVLVFTSKYSVLSGERDPAALDASTPTVTPKRSF